MRNRPHMRTMAVGALALAVGCASPGVRPTSSSMPDLSGASDRPSAELLRKQLANDARLDDVGSALLRAGAPRCAETVPRAGFRLFNLPAFSRPWQRYASQLGYTDTVQVLSVAKGSGAERAGLRAGDRVISLDLQPATPGARIVDALRARIVAAGERGQASVAITIRRDGRETALTVPLDKSCAVDLMSWRQDAPDAWSDGRTIAVTTGMLSFAATDGELGVLLAHEIAHADLIRRTQRNAWQSLVHGSAQLTESAIGLASDDRFVRMRSARPETPWDAATERAADEFTFSLLRAVGAPTSGVHAFWRRVLLPDPAEFPYAITHPMSMERILWLEVLEKAAPPKG